MSRVFIHGWPRRFFATLPVCAALAFTCVAIPAAAAAESDPGAVIPTRQRGLSIPFEANASDPSLEVHLFISEDRGQTWRFYDRQQPAPGAVRDRAGNPVDGGSFQFRASRDGEYWFASRAVDNRRRYDPPRNMLPETRVLIDTLEPKIDLQATAGPSGEVKVAWKIFDENLQSESLKLEVQSSSDTDWQPLAIDRSRLGRQLTHVAGEASWWPKSASPEIAVRAEVRDASGNVAVVNRRLGATGELAQGSRGSAAANAPVSNPAAANPPAGSAPTAGSAPPAAPPPAERLPGERMPAVARPASTGAAQFGSPDGAPTDPFAQRRREKPIAPPQSPPQSPARSTPWPIDRDPGGASADRTKRESPSPRSGEEFTSQETSPPSRDAVAAADSFPAGERPQMTTSRRFRLDYDVDAVGPSGLGKVELWYTRDRGRSWHSKGYDADKQSPFDVEVDSEGLYGFRILIENGDGLASRMPQPGDPADLWVMVDWSVPEARLTSAIYGVGAKAGKLEIGWKAEDANLSDRPITLSFSEQATGPWSTIAAGLENTGVYSWKVDPRIPERIFLRLEVRDLAGNVQVDQLREPISIEGLAPKGRIRGFQLDEETGKEATRPSGRRQ